MNELDTIIAEILYLSWTIYSGKNLGVTHLKNSRTNWEKVMIYSYLAFDTDISKAKKGREVKVSTHSL